MRALYSQEGHPRWQNTRHHRSRPKKLPASGFKLYLSSANGQSILIHNMRPQHQVRIRSYATARENHEREQRRRHQPKSPHRNSPRAGQSTSSSTSCSAGFMPASWGESSLLRCTHQARLVAPASRQQDAGATKTARTTRYFFLLFAFFCFSSTTACAAANLEIGTRNGDALT